MTQHTCNKPWTFSLQQSMIKKQLLLHLLGYSKFFSIRNKEKRKHSWSFKSFNVMLLQTEINKETKLFYLLWQTLQSQWVPTICQTCIMLSSDTEQITHGSLGFQEKSEILAVWPPWMNWKDKSWFIFTLWKLEH